MDIRAALVLWLREALSCRLITCERVDGGCTNESLCCDTSAGRFFVKTADAYAASMFEAEAAGLCELQKTQAIRVPEVAAQGVHSDFAFLALEWIDFAPARTRSEERLGLQLAILHRTVATQYGWHRDNTIGATPQKNSPTASWIEFWRESRLHMQLTLAEQKGANTALLDSGWQLSEMLPELLGDHTPTPSLLHGDLWSGNWASDVKQQPVVFDPAVYYGDRETDIAMTRLFGGFGEPFYRAYETAWPLDSGAPLRASLYNLYHILNHYLLFGSTYESQAQRLMQRLLAEVRC